MGHVQSCKDLPHINYRGFWFILLFTAQPSNQSPMSLTSDASSPRSYVSPRISTPQTNTVPIKPLISTPPVSSQPKVSSDKTWSTGEGNGKPLHYFCRKYYFENPMNIYTKGANIKGFRNRDRNVTCITHEFKVKSPRHWV